MDATVDAPGAAMSREAARFLDRYNPMTYEEVLEIALASRPTPQLTTPPATEKPAKPVRRGRKGPKQVQAH